MIFFSFFDCAVAAALARSPLTMAAARWAAAAAVSWAPWRRMWWRWRARASVTAASMWSKLARSGRRTVTWREATHVERLHIALPFFNTSLLKIFFVYKIKYEWERSWGQFFPIFSFITFFKNCRIPKIAFETHFSSPFFWHLKINFKFHFLYYWVMENPNQFLFFWRILDEKAGNSKACCKKELQNIAFWKEWNF